MEIPIFRTGSRDSRLRVAAACRRPWNRRAVARKGAHDANALAFCQAVSACLYYNEVYTDTFQTISDTGLGPIGWEGHPWK